MPAKHAFGQPSKLFEESTGCTGIAANYRYPEGKTAEELQQELTSQAYYDLRKEQMFAGYHGQVHFDANGYPPALQERQAEITRLKAQMQERPDDTTVAALYQKLFGEQFLAMSVSEDNTKRFTRSEDLGKAEADMMDEFRRVHAELVALNPELGAIKVADKRSLNAVVMGALSQYNTDDITSFIANEERHPLVAKLYTKYVEPHGVPAGWVMSDATALKVIEQLHPDVARHSNDFARAKSAISPPSRERT